MNPYEKGQENGFQAALNYISYDPKLDGLLHNLIEYGKLRGWSFKWDESKRDSGPR